YLSSLTQHPMFQSQRLFRHPSQFRYPPVLTRDYRLHRLQQRRLFDRLLVTFVSKLICLPVISFHVLPLSLTLLLLDQLYLGYLLIERLSSSHLIFSMLVSHLSHLDEFGLGYPSVLSVHHQPPSTRASSHVFHTL